MSDSVPLSAESWYEQDSFDFYKFTYERGQFDVPSLHSQQKRTTPVI
jgi:hypothetical protein